jgi:hypothetical protein
MSTSRSSHHRPGPAAIAIVPIVAALVLTLFAWPNARLEPRDLPVGVAGAPAVERQLSAQDGAFDVHLYADEAAAREAIEDREVYGAFVGGPDGAKVLTASAASPAVAQILTHAASAAGAAGAGAAVEDVVPAGPSGSALPSSVLPLVLAGIVCGVMSAALATSALRRVALLLTGAILAGLAGTAIVQSWLDVVGGDWAANAAVIGFTVLAIATVVAGLEAVAGKAGAIGAALTMILIGNPFSGVASGPEMLPEPAAGIGQLLPPGAGGNLLRSTGFFDGAAAGGHVTVLAAWTLAGLAALLLAALRGRRPAPAAAPATA